jgi:transmembrane sensor
MQIENNIPTQKETQWTSFLNGEPDVSVDSIAEAKEMEDLTSLWEAAGTNYSYFAADPEKAWLNIQNERTKAEKIQQYKIFKLRVLKYAAMIVVILGAGFAAYQVMNKPEKQIEAPLIMAVTETEAHPLNLTIVTLPDGSTVKMNASTRIEYPERFASNIRKVKLTGEAFFDITHDATRPFIVETANASVEVLGTSFNVSAYPNSGLVEVNVENGKVKLTQNTKGITANKFEFLLAGHHGWLKVAEGQMGQEKMLAPNYSSWITKEIVFQHTPLAEAFQVLENTYHVRIKMETSDIGTITSNTNFANKELDFIVDVIARTHKLKVTRNTNEIIFAKE